MYQIYGMNTIVDILIFELYIGISEPVYSYTELELFKNEKVK